jgi:DNA-binding response OmpR family regulator
MRYGTILIVEDDPALRQVIAKNLRARGHEASEASMSAEALEFVQQHRPDLLLLDISLPDETGWELLRELRERDIAVPTVIISAVRVTSARLDEFQPIAFLPKPFPMEALLRIVENGQAQEKSEMKAKEEESWQAPGHDRT